jgi:hypothetical protein
MNTINGYNFDKMNDPNFGKRKQSRHIEIQTDLKMGTINKYEASIVDTGFSSDKNEKRSLPTVINGGDKVFSDFGQIFNGSKEYPSKN